MAFKSVLTRSANTSSVVLTGTSLGLGSKAKAVVYSENRKKTVTESVTQPQTNRSYANPCH